MPISSWEKWKQRDAQVEAALLAFRDSPAGDVSELSVKPEQTEAAAALEQAAAALEQADAALAEFDRSRIRGKKP